MRILIAGGGQGAALIAGRLIREGNQVTIVEKDPERCRQLEESLDAKVVRGNAGSFRTLEQAGLADTEMLIADTDSDEINLLCCMMAQADSNAKVKVARVRTHEFGQWDRIGREMGLQIDRIIHPETEIMERIKRVVRVPGVSDILDFAEGEIKLFGMNVEIDSWFAGKTVVELDQAHPPPDCLIAMIFPRPAGDYPARRATPGARRSHLHLHHAQKPRCRDGVHGIKKQKSIERVFIVGGKQVGIWVAEELEKQGVQVKLIERDQRRCDMISTILNKTIVVRGDGTDQGTLEEENVEGVDAFLALTNDDEDNIIASLLARRLGAQKVRCAD